MDEALRTRVKICCIENPEALALAVRAGANAIGLVGPMPSGTGIIDLPTAARLVELVPAPVQSVLLTSAIDALTMIEQARITGAHALQIVDRVPSSTYPALRRALPALRIVQVVHVEGEPAIAEALGLDGLVDAVLLDSGRRDGPVLRLGGTGQTHDWRLSRRIVEALRVPVWLAGGLTPANVADAIRTVSPYGVDLCTGLRTEGRLDAVKLQAFIDAVRSVEG